MRRKRLLLLALTCSLGLSAGCQCSSCDRPSLFSRWFGRSESAAPPCCDGAGGQVIYDGPALPDGATGPIIAPTAIPPGVAPPLPSPTPIQPQAAAIPYGNGNGNRLVPQSQPMPYVPPR